MADGSFPGLVSRNRDTNAQTNTIWVRLSDDTNAVSLTGTYLDVNIASGSLTVDYSYIDDSAFGVATDNVAAVGMLADETTPDSVDEGDIGIPRMTLDRKQLMVIADATTDSQRLAIDASGRITSNINGTVNVDIQDTWSAETGGGVEANALRVTIANDSTGLLSIDDNGGSITVDGTVTVTATDLDIRNLNLTDDAVKVSANATANSETNPIFVYQVNTIVSGSEVHNYDTSTVATDTADNHDYTVAGTTFFLKSVICSGSGNVKFEIQTGPVASLVTRAVGFLNGRQGDTKQVFFEPAIEVPATSTGTVRVIRTNRQGTSADVYSTIIGNDVA